MNNLDRAANLHSQIQKRLELLQLWVGTGVPMGFMLPRSLAGIRRWKNPDLGIHPIGSTSSFTKSHPKHGSLITQIDACLKHILKKPSKKTRRNSDARSRALKRQNDEFKAALTAAANQYVVQRVHIERTEAQVRILEQNVEELESENAILRRTGGHQSSPPNREKGNVTELVPRNDGRRDTRRQR